MSTIARRLVVMTLVGLGPFVTDFSEAQGQVPLRNQVVQARAVAIQSQIASQLAINQWANNVALARSVYNNPYYGGLGGFPAAPAYYPSPAAYANPYGQAAGPTMTSMSTSPSSAGGPTMTSQSYPTAPPPDYYNPYTPYNSDPLGGYLRGVASVYSAQGRAMIDREQSYLMREQVKQAQVDTRRKIFDEWQYERQNTPTLQDIREKNIKLEQRRAMTEPPITEVLSGDSLNTLLNLIKSKPSEGAPNITLTEEVVKHINVAPPGGNGNLAAIKKIKEGAPLSWPLALQNADYEADRKALDQLLPSALSDASTKGNVEPGTMQDLLAGVKRLKEKLGNNVGDMPPTQYIESKRFLNQLSEALAALQTDVDKYFNKLKVKTVTELVQAMAGLKIVSAGNGDEPAYQALQQALAKYSAAVSGGKD